jgi:tRNA1Val (adenine37-N6)-methyltransferase
MANTYFQFKQFIIHQDQCAMKVSTDSCLFGAWLSKEIIPSLSNIHHVLDIGAGTGLLMLMQAQEHMIAIDGIELDNSAYQQALSNIELSHWKDRLQLFKGDVISFEFGYRYDLIISNPPFYENNLKPLSHSKASAMHDATLNLGLLLGVIEKNINHEGYFALLIPFYRFEEMKDLFLSKDFYLHKVSHVRHQEGHKFIRSMVLLSRKPAEATIQYITIKEKDGAYTNAFKELLYNYYLQNTG